MRSPVPFATCAALMALALLMVMTGFGLIVSRPANIFLGIMLILAGLGLLRFARNARAAHLYRQRMGRLQEWAQALGPRGRKRP